TPESGFTGDPTPITYTVDDNDGGTSAPATVSVDYPVVVPVAVDDLSSANTVGSTVGVDVVVNDSDSDGTIDVTSVSLVVPVGAINVITDADGDVAGFTVPNEGAWQVNPLTGEVSFIPDASFTSDPTPVAYTVDDNDGNISNVATVTVDYVPVAVDDLVTDNTTGIPVVVDVLANDTAGDLVDPATVQIVGTTNPGDSLLVAGEGEWTVDSVTGAITFTPESGFTSDPTPIEYTVSDDEGNVSDSAEIVLTFTPELPIAVDDAVVGVTGTPTVVDVLANDSDSDGTLDPTTVAIIDPATGLPVTTLIVPGEGEWVVDPITGQITFTPESGFTGDPTPITYTVDDNDGNTSASATVSVDFSVVFPVAEDDISLGNTPGGTVSVDVLGNDTDTDGSIDPTTVSLVLPSGSINIVIDADGDVVGYTLPGEGEWQVNPITGELTFIPESGFVSSPTPVGYTVDDNDGNPSNVATVSIEVVVTCDDVIDGTVDLVALFAEEPLNSIFMEDCDGDGVANGTEVLDGTDPIDPCNFIIDSQTLTTSGIFMAADCDGDGVTNGQEVADGTDLMDPCDFLIVSQTETTSEAWGAIDCDGDGVVNGQELLDGTDSQDPCDFDSDSQNPAIITMNYDDLDCDGDGVTNGQEMEDGTNPNDSCDFNLTNQDVVPTTEWYDEDCDGDGVTNGDELNDGTDPQDACDFVYTSQTVTIRDTFADLDCDGDGVTNGQEIADGTDPTDLCDFVVASQTIVGSDEFNNGDCDGDGVSNEIEIIDGTDPLDPCDYEFTSQVIDYETQTVEGVSDDWLLLDCDGDSTLNGDEIADNDNNGIPDYEEADNGDTDAPDGLIVFDIMTPDGDGNNDVFVISGIQQYPENTLKIYNRWGVKVYDVDGYGQGNNFFRGTSEGRVTVKKDDKLPVGTYYYVLTYVNESGNSVEKAGPLYINRN
uniref:T9SS type B sorting domain-containing protein n=1 Tax=Olleya namhaensis TaxID=1144750 RepID=UPI00232CEE02